MPVLVFLGFIAVIPALSLSLSLYFYLPYTHPQPHIHAYTYNCTHTSWFRRLEVLLPWCRLLIMLHATTTLSLQQYDTVASHYIIKGSCAAVVCCRYVLIVM